MQKDIQALISRYPQEADSIMRGGELDISYYNNYIKLLERRDEAEIGELLFRCCAMTISLLRALGIEEVDSFKYDFIKEAFPQALLWLY